jgi:hypothetical protein|uniref:Uncharacterized protein n=1 Tax=Ralstonia pickettii (strain 12D) TaxID=428406 RepID=C6BPQ5_RALP1
MSENALLRAVSAFPNLASFGKSPSTPIKLKEKAVSLTLKIVLPYCGSAEEILARRSQP